MTPAKVELPVEAPSKGKAFSVWRLWATLYILSQLVTEEEPTATAIELRAQLYPQVFKSASAMDEALNDLRGIKAIEGFNMTGSTNRRYGLTDIGYTLMDGYRDYLDKTEE